MAFFAKNTISENGGFSIEFSLNFILNAYNRQQIKID